MKMDSNMAWQKTAKAKRASILAKIPPKWRLSAEDLERASKLRELSGFLQSFLDPKEIAIVSMDSVPIVNALRDAKLSAVQTVTAFCKVAALAHQTVSLVSYMPGRDVAHKLQT